jgi:ATP-dependent Lon protease
MAISEVSQKITSAVDESLSKQQKEFFLRQQLSAIQKELTDLHRGTNAPGRRDGVIGGGSELDDEDESGGDYAELRKRIDALAKGTEVRAMAVREFKRLKRIPPNSVENGVIRSYLEWLTALPWPSASQPIQEETLAVLRDPQFLSNARKQLDSDHFGLDKIKRRLIEHLAIIRIKELHRAATNSTTTNTPSKSSTIKAPILLLVGPPGVGKTSIASSLARTLQRPFNRISLGGVRDEAEIRGHRRTYVASGPGAIVQALRKAGRPDSVILLDEIDKVGHSSFHGDPSAALLEVLDPEQNHTFKDHYIDVPIDLSQTLFIATANTLDTIPAPLLDRCEVIQLSGYTYDEKLSIARRYLLPKQLAQNGLPAEQLELTEAAMLQLATGYTRESGVRSLEREIGAVVRYKTVEWADHQDAAVQAPYEKQVTEADLIKILGMPRWENEERDREERRGIAWGLVVMGEGQGGILPVETLTTPGSGKLMLTGSLGEVIRESGELALSWVKSHAYQLGITKSRYEDPLKMTDRGAIDIHLHLPSGAQKKDGPSAGVAMVCAFVSLLSGYTMPTNLAMTGEITLRGRVTAVGGIKEKVLGAYRGGMSKLILPYANRKDVEQDVAPEIRDAMEFVFVKSVEEALEAAFGIGTLGRSGMGPILVESRL